MTATVTEAGLPLAAQSLSLRVGGDEDGRWLVRDLNLRLPPGDITALVGPNGSGKSTLLRCLCGLQPAREGTVRLGDTPVASLAPRLRAKAIAYLPQDTPLVHDLRVAEVVALGRAPHRGRWLSGLGETTTAVDEALERVEATPLRHRRISTLSGGERQRVMLARMLATGATHLLMDEPTTALDIGHALTLHALMRSLAEEGHAVTVAMHDLDAARHLADTALVLDPREGDGAYHYGDARQVLGARVLGEVFGVRALEVDGHLRFEPA